LLLAVQQVEVQAQVLTLTVVAVVALVALEQQQVLACLHHLQ
jgi:hypothetical protein